MHCVSTVTVTKTVFPDAILAVCRILLQIEIKKYRCGLAVLITSAASCDETVK